ncbi:DUF3951 domain-containing protein [Halobacillus litoralis]|uniref:DUF3951 domain-containing protein n=1 Tax=Halobacillus litoralis TaxID=45668 RepID=UPI001CD2DD0B|nr:DUF3951 domain-containing protein [Halobacillus litoralis]MCA0970228.1 DUF3951 domain-containing protein [Halobacillus litoralis]
MTLFYSIPLILLALLTLLIGRQFYQVMIKKNIPENYYTPFDHITGHAVHEFQEESLENQQEEEEGTGDNKHKNEEGLR